MTSSEREFLCEIMWLALMERGLGMCSKSPEYIKEKMRRKQDPLALWQGMGLDAKSIVKCYFDRWCLPLDKLLSEITNSEQEKKRILRGDGG